MQRTSGMQGIVRLIFGFGSAAFLAACDPLIHRSDAEEIAEDFADAEASRVRQELGARIDELEDRVDDLEGDTKSAASLARVAAADASFTAGAVSKNARVANEN